MAWKPNLSPLTTPPQGGVVARWKKGGGSMAWKSFSAVFHGMGASFRKSSTAWKAVLPFFHGMEASFPWRGSFTFRPLFVACRDLFSCPRFSKHWKEVSMVFQGLEAGFGKSSKDWKRVLGGAEEEFAEKIRREVDLGVQGVVE